VVAIQSAGNLATTQAVVTSLTENIGTGGAGRDLSQARTMFEVAEAVGVELRATLARDADFVKPYGDPGASFLVGGQIRGEPPRLFEVYAAGNFVEAADRTFFLQIGETKYGKPILDRALSPAAPLDEAAKLALLSFDATLRSNLSVGPPIDLVLYAADSFSAEIVSVAEDNPYWAALREGYADGLAALVAGLPAPPADWTS
jgi:putative proteasome-type protease